MRDTLHLEREPFGQRNEALLIKRNRLLPFMFFDLLESASNEDIYMHKAIPAAYARSPVKKLLPTQ
jgi:hypothetical protein